jgi:hypothetical protein
MLAVLPSAFALVSVSQLGFHPGGTKTVTEYTGAASATYTILDSSNTVVRTGTLSKPVDYWGNQVLCQGDRPCLVADFSSLTTSGTYHITTSLGETSAPFTINANIYKTTLPLFNEFFDATSMRNSSYHADMNRFADPSFLAMFDGSYIMTSQQASVALIRLGDAYRRNPAALSSDTRTFVRPNTPDIVEHMMLYTEYLEQLQDAQIQVQSNGAGFRLGTNIGAGITPDFVFVPAQTSMSSINIYTGTGSFVQSLPVQSLCGNLSGGAYTACINDAETFYKCQPNEPCMQQSYKGQTGLRVPGIKASRGMPNGWIYEWNCYFDVDLQNGNFNTQSQPNSCMIFDRTESNANTAVALLAYAEAIPAINQYDNAKAMELLGRAVQTQQYLKPGASSFSSDDAGYFGAASFLLYDLTGNSTYLGDAYSVRGTVSTQLVSDQTHGNEYYWQEYIRHKSAITGAGMVYPVSGVDPVNFFDGKIWGDYKDLGFRSISDNGEHVYRIDTDYSSPMVYQNSRFMLTEGLFAAKDKDLFPGANPAIQNVADSQLAWITGNNGVDTSASLTPNIQSVSFIYGIGSFPSQFHSRLLMDSGYAGTPSSFGPVIGMHGNDFTWSNGTAYNYFDGRTYLLNTQLGSQGNRYNGEQPATQLVLKTFNNGKSYIPGWISGAYDLNYDSDTILNFHDDRNAFEFTETTAEIVATAIDLFAYQDANYNGATPLATPLLGNPNSTGGGGTIPPNSTCYESVQNIPATCTGGTMTTDTFNGCTPRSIWSTSCTARWRPLGIRYSTGSWPSSGTMVMRRLFL